MKKRALILLMLTALWSIGSWWWYTCKIKGFCIGSNKALNTQAGKNPPSPVATPIKPSATTQIIDSDGDGLSDNEEKALGTNPRKTDTDGDGVPDNQEVGSDPSSALDTDGDGEINALDVDDDNDTLKTLLENAIGTNPLLKDTDNDGADDAVEVGSNTGTPLDTDGDKIINALDPDDDNDGLPSSEEKILGTNPLKTDTDGDGIPDGEEVGNSKGDTKDKAKDSDGDGVIDALDAKVDPDLGPDIPPEPKDLAIKEEATKQETTKQDKSNDDEVTVEPVKSSNNTSIQGSLLYFPFRSAEPKLSKSAKKYFTKVANWLKESADNKVILTGHTDNIGSKSVNRKLGLKRAAIIRKMLIKQGAPKKQIKIRSKGESKPIKSNKTEAGRRKNRRVELSPFGKGVSAK